LWRAAAEIAAQRGMNITACVLRLDTKSLTKWMAKQAGQAQGPAEPKRAKRKYTRRKVAVMETPATFLELLAPFWTVMRATPRRGQLDRSGAVQQQQQAAASGTRLGRPATSAVKAADVRKLFSQGISKSEISRRLDIGRTSVRRILAQNKP